MIKIPVLYSDDFLTDYRTVDCENPERAWIIQSAIREIADFREPDLCSRTNLLLCHTESLIKSVESDEEVFSVARRAAGGAIMAAEIALTQPSFGLIRPPGHHAGRNFNGGFCFFNNMAVALSTLFSRGCLCNMIMSPHICTMKMSPHTYDNRKHQKDGRCFREERSDIYHG